jgi:hypothetical protein
VPDEATQFHAAFLVATKRLHFCGRLQEFSEVSTVLNTSLISGYLLATKVIQWPAQARSLRAVRTVSDALRLLHMSCHLLQEDNCVVIVQEYAAGGDLLR